MKRERKVLGMLALCSLLVWGAGVSARQSCTPEPLKTGRQNMIQQLAWWGSLYPRACLEGAMRLVGETSEGTDELPIKIKWKCKDLF